MSRTSRFVATLLTAVIAVGCSSSDPESSTPGGGIGGGDNAYLLPAPRGFTTAEVQIPMDDGVIISADEHVPELAHRVPTVISFYPYGRKLGVAGESLTFPAEYGYAKLTVDVRGTGASEGVWDVFGPREQEDYAAIIRWATMRPYNDGTVVLQGTSGGGISALLAAQQPGMEAVKAVVVRVAAGDLYRDIASSGGSPNSEFITIWSVGLIGVPALYQPALSLRTGPQVALNATSQHLARTLPFVLGQLVLAPLFGEYQPGAGLDATYDSEWFRVRSPVTHIDRIQAPTMIYGAAFDLFARAQPMIFDALPLPSDRKKLVMVSGYHFFSPSELSSSDGTTLIRDDRGNVVPAENNMRVAWYDRWAKGAANHAEQMPPAQIAYIGGDGYVAQDAALPRRRPLRYYLDGGGALAPTVPASPGADHLPSFPITGLCSRNTFQNLGGGTLETFRYVLPVTVPLPEFDWPCTTDNRINELDGLTFTTAPVTETTRIAGPANLRVWIRSTRPDTLLFATVTDVAPDGTSTQVSYGHLLASHRRLVETPCKGPKVVDCSVYLGGELIQPWHPYTRDAQEALRAGEVHPLDIEVMPMFVELKPGHALRVTIKTGDFPKAMPTVSTLLDSLGGVTTVMYDAAHPSSLLVGEVVP